MHKKIISTFFLMTFMIAGCGEQNEVKTVDLHRVLKQQKTPKPESAIGVGIASITSPKDGFIYYEELLSYINERISHPIFLKQGHYKMINDALGSGEIKLAFVCSGGYVEANKDYGAEILAIPVIKGKASYHSYIIVNKESQVTSFRQLKGKSIALADTLSCTGYVYPIFLLSKEKKQPKEFFSKTIFMHGHDNTIHAVTEKLVDATAVNSLVYERLAETDPSIAERTKIIDVSPALGMPPVVVSRALNPRLKTQLGDLFLNLHNDPRGKKILKALKIDKFVRGDDRAYDIVRAMKTAVGREW